VAPDNEPEMAEVFTLTLTSVDGGARVASGNGAVATIVVRGNDDSIAFGGASVLVREDAGVAAVVVTRGGDRDDTATVQWRTVEGSAGDGSDFRGGVGEVVFGPGDIAKTILIPIIDDTEPEFLESFQVQLLSVAGDAVISATDMITVTIMASDDATGVFGEHNASPQPSIALMWAGLQ